MKTLASTGIGARCQTPKELSLALECGFRGEDILFSAVHLTEETSALLREKNILFAAASDAALGCPLPRKVLLQVWVPRGKHVMGTAHTHRPGLGFTKEELPKTLKKLAAMGVEESGILLRYDPGVQSEDFLARQLEAAQKLCQSVEDSPVPLSAIHLDGGYTLNRNRTKLLPQNTDAMAEKFTEQARAFPNAVSLCLGDLVAEPNCLYFAEVLGYQERFSPVLITDANSEDLVSFGVDRYHHISVLGKRHRENRVVSDVMGCVPRAGDWLAKCRILPQTEAGDILVFHDVGSSISPAASAPTILLRKNGSVSLLQKRKED